MTQKQSEQDEKNLSSSATASSRSHYGTSAATSQANAAQAAEYEADEEAGLELPPPMKPLQEPHLMANGPPVFAKDLKENSKNLVSQLQLQQIQPINFGVKSPEDYDLTSMIAEMN